MKLFEDLPSKNRPFTAENLNQIQDNLVVVSSTEPTGDNREKVWMQKGKNLFNGQISAGDQIGQNSSIRLYTRQEIFVKKGSTITFSTNLNTNTYQYLFQLLEKVPGYYLSQRNYTQIFDSGWKAASTFSYTATQDGYIALGFRKADNSALTPSDISGYQYQIEYGPTATEYEEYIEPKIYILNDNDVYEEYVNVARIPKEVESADLSYNSTKFQKEVMRFVKYGNVVQIAIKAIALVDIAVSDTDTITVPYISIFKNQNVFFAQVGTQWPDANDIPIRWGYIDNDGKIRIKLTQGEWIHLYFTYICED